MNKPVKKIPFALLLIASEVLRFIQRFSQILRARARKRASQKFQGKQLNENTVGLLINALMGTQSLPETSGAADQSLLGSLLGS